MMVNRGYGDRCRIETELGPQQFLDRRKCANAVSRLRLGGTARVGIQCSYQFNAGARGLQFPVNTKMVAAKGACPRNRDPHLGAGVYFAAPLPSTAFRQRP